MKLQFAQHEVHRVVHRLIQHFLYDQAIEKTVFSLVQ